MLQLLQCQHCAGFVQTGRGKTWVICMHVNLTGNTLQCQHCAGFVRTGRGKTWVICMHVNLTGNTLQCQHCAGFVRTGRGKTWVICMHVNLTGNTLQDQYCAGFIWTRQWILEHFPKLLSPLSWWHVPTSLLLYNLVRLQKSETEWHSETRS